MRGSQFAADVLRWAMRSRRRGVAAVPSLAAGVAEIGPDPRAFGDWFTARFPGAAREIVAEADGLLAGQARLFWQAVPLRPADDTWHRDWVTGGTMPAGFQRWIRRPVIRAQGDVKRVWEVNRHQWLVRLGQAALLTGAPGYTRAARALLTSWMHANPPDRGVNWRDALEMSIRLVAWWTALPLFGDAARGWPEWPEIVRCMERQLRSVETHLSYFSSPNTHLLGEGLALFVGALVLPEAPRAGRWREQGYAILNAELERQVGLDGGHREKSAYYHCYALEMFLLATIVGRRNGITFRSDWDARVGRMAEVLQALVQPDGSVSRIGDDDGGRLLSLGAHDYYRPGDVLAAAAAVLKRADLAKGVGDDLPAALGWLLGRHAVENSPPPPPGGCSAWFADMGIGVARTSWDAQAAWCTLQGAPLGMLGAGHSHAGLGSVEITLAGRPIIVDPGTYSYHAAEWRDRFRSADAHNGITVAGMEPHVPAGAFRMNDRGVAHGVGGGVLGGGEGGLEVRYGLRAGGVSIDHRRQVALLGPRRVLVRDDLTGDGVYPVTLRWHLASDCRATPSAPGVFEITSGGRPIARLRVDGPHLDAEARRDWVSPAYDRREPGDVLVFRALTALPARWVWELKGLL